jgi:flagellar biosynthesis/type III secretory pathway M-ring protein FliF/YscJ
MVTIFQNASNLTILSVPNYFNRTRLFSIPNKVDPLTLKRLVDFFNNTSTRRTTPLIVPNISTNQNNFENVILITSIMTMLLLLMFILVVYIRRRRFRTNNNQQNQTYSVDDEDNDTNFDHKDHNVEDDKEMVSQHKKETKSSI